MKLSRWVVGVLLVSGLAYGGLRVLEDYILLPPLASADLPVHPKYARAFAYDSTAKAPTYSTTGSVWRRLVNVAGGQPSAIASGSFLMDGGSVTFETAFGSAPNCVCGLAFYDGGTIQSVTCPATTTTMTPWLNGGASIGSEAIKYICVGALP